MCVDVLDGQFCQVVAVVEFQFREVVRGDCEDGGVCETAIADLDSLKFGGLQVFEYGEEPIGIFRDVVFLGVLDDFVANLAGQDEALPQHSMTSFAFCRNGIKVVADVLIT